MGIWYATREQVQESLEVMNTARSNFLVDQKLDSASRSIEGLLHRRFYPEIRTVKIDFPNWQFSDAWQLYLDSNELVSLTSMTGGGVTIPGANTILRRFDDLAEPPYSVIEILTQSGSAFGGGASFQQNTVLTGVFGYNATDVSLAHALLSGSINASVTTIVLNPSSGTYKVGVGSILLIDTERLIVTDRRLNDTNINTAGTLAALQSAQSLAVPDGTQFAIGEVILVDAERMRIDDIAGNTLIVTRAWDGTTLATHESGVDIYARRTFIVQRGALGTTAASHTTAAPVYAHQFPGLVNELCIAEAVTALEQNASAYARTVGSGANVREAAGKGLEDLRYAAYTAYGRMNRLGAV